MNIGIIFGGNSYEHEVSIVSASNVICNLNKDKYTIYPIYLDKDNNWFLVKDKIIKPYVINEYPKKLKKIDPYLFLKKIDLVLPIMHGAYGEDGTIQGFLKMLNIKYIGCDILSSSVCIDKFYTKYLLKNAGINVTPDIVIKYFDNNYYLMDKFDLDKVNINEIDNIIKKELNYPVFIKPASLGSSVGVTKASNKKELDIGLKEAIKFDDKVLIEKEIVGRELECAILNGNAMSVGEIHAHGKFYSYDSKYNDNESFTEIPDDIPDLEIKKIAEKAFRVVSGKNIARIDFFLEDKTNKIYLNEINTMPGFTNISMYPLLVEHSGISYQELLDILIENYK